MQADTRSHNDLIDGLVRQAFGVEPGAMAALARGDEETRLRRLPLTTETTDPLDGLDLLMRRTVALALRLRGHHGAVQLVTERQAVAAGWPDARLANTCIVLAWALAVTEPVLSVPVLLEADEHAGDAMVSLIRVDDFLPSLRDMRERLQESARIDHEAMERVSEARGAAPALANAEPVSLDAWLTDRLGIDAGTVELPADRCDPPLQGRNARAVGALAWLVTGALDLGSAMEADAVAAVRLKTNPDARLAGEPGADLANVALLLGAAIRHGGGYTVHFLPPNATFAEALVEAGDRVRKAGTYRNGDAETRTVTMFDLKDLAARGYVHVGRQAVGNVAWRQVHEDA